MQEYVMENTPSSPIPIGDMGMLHQIAPGDEQIYVSHIVQKGQFCDVYDTLDRLIPELCGTYKGLLYRLTDKHNLTQLKTLTDDQATLNLE